MNEIKVSFVVEPKFVALQCISLIHVVLACAATVGVLKKRKELNFGVFPALLIAWLIPCVGPVSVLWGLREAALKRST